MQGKKYLSTPEWFKMLFLGFGRDLNDAESLVAETITHHEDGIVVDGGDDEDGIVDNGGEVEDTRLNNKEWKDLNGYDRDVDDASKVCPGGYKWSHTQITNQNTSQSQDIDTDKDNVVSEEKLDDKDDTITHSSQIRQRNM